MVGLVAMIGICGMITWGLAQLAYGAFQSGLTSLGVMLTLGTTLMSCVTIRGIKLLLFGTEPAGPANTANTSTPDEHVHSGAEGV